MKSHLLAPIVSLNNLAKKRGQLKNVILAGGTFDIIHTGHAQHLQKAKSLGGILIVHVTTDARVKEKKGDGRPVFTENERAALIAALKPVDYVFLHSGRHYDLDVLNKIKPDILFFNKEGFTNLAKKNVKSFKGKVVVDKLPKVNSTSRIIKNLAESVI